MGNITILGTGRVAQVIASKLLGLGHSVTMGTRDPEATKSRTEPDQMTGMSFSEWYGANPGIQLQTYAGSATGAELVINATNGGASIEALRAVGKENLAGKVLLDLANPLDFSEGMPPSLFVVNKDSLGETIQREFPDTKVVKSLNTMNAMLMVDPGSLASGDHSVFLSGNDEDAKDQVRAFLASLGWSENSMIDLGDITTARGSEQLLPIWIRLWGALGTPNFNFKIVRE